LSKLKWIDSSQPLGVFDAPPVQIRRMCHSHRTVHLGRPGERNIDIRLTGRGIDVAEHTSGTGWQPFRSDAQLNCRTFDVK
jgi:hypothetical protein